MALLSQRNFDPDTRTLRRADVTAIEDTVEKNVDGLVEEILAADKERQEAELVNIGFLYVDILVLNSTRAGPLKHRPKTSQLGSKTRP